MENEKINLHMTPDEQNVVTILHGKALDPKAPEKINICGTISSVLRWLDKKANTCEGGDLDLIKCHLLISRDKGGLKLVINETDPLNIGDIVGEIKLSSEFAEFGINSGQQRTPNDLAEFIRMNRSYFANKDVAAKLVSLLRDFKGKVDLDIESFRDDRANMTTKRQQAVTTNIPAGFALKMRIFKGAEPVQFEVEISINADTLSCGLISVEANDFIKEETDKMINEQIKLIADKYPQLAIIEV
jgi:hypothetical protein